MPALPRGLKKFYIVFSKGSDKEGFYTVVEATWQGDAEIYAQTYWPSHSYRIYSSGSFWSIRNSQSGRKHLKELPKELA